MIKKFIKNINKKAVLINCLILSFILLNVNSVFAEDLINNPITEGLKKMSQDGLNALMGLSTIVAVVMIAIQLMKKHYTGDEMESKQCNKRMIVIIVSWIALMSVSGILKIIGGYFNISGV